MSARETTKTLLERLQRHYIKPGSMPGGVFIPECGVNGGTQTRADALYVGFTSTSGRILIGHELKVSRADWRKELDSSGKADFWADNCHAWYIVAPSTEIVPAEELPHGWGLMVPNPRTTTRMQVVVKAEVNKDRVPSWSATRSMFARLDTLMWQQIGRAQQDAQKKVREDARELARQNVQNGLTREQRDRLGVLDKLEELIGEPITPWGVDKLDPPKVAAAITLVRAASPLVDSDRYSAAILRRSAESLIESLDQYEAARSALLTLVGRAS